MLRRSIVAFVFLLVLPAVLAQTAAKPADYPANQKKKTVGDCTVSGRVVTAAEGTPLSSARVALIEANQRKHPLVYATTTDKEGHFAIKQVEAGRYEFVAAHIGYLEQRYQARTADEQGAILTLAAGQVVDDAMFRLLRACVITGRVTDDTGEPMEGVNISVLHKPSEEEQEKEGPRVKKLEMTMVSSGQTDDRGEYRVFGLKPGEYFVKAADNNEVSYSEAVEQMDAEARVKQELGSETAPVYYPGALQPDQAQVITLTAGEEVQADFAMQKVRLVEVAGKVVAPDGGPGNRAFVQLRQANMNDWVGELGTTTDGSGEFSIKGVAPGTYYLSAFLRDKDKFHSTRQKIEVGESKIDSIVLVMGGGAIIHGRMRTASGAPLPESRISVTLQAVGQEQATEYSYAQVNKDGAFEVANVADGSFTVATNSLESGWFVRSIHVGSEDIFQDGLQVEGGAVKGSLEIVLSNDGAQIEGTVTDNDKHEPLVGVVLKAKADPSTDYNYMRTQSATTDQHGHYVLKDLPPGKYRVTAKLAASGPGTAPVHSEPVFMTVGSREQRKLDFTLTLPKSE